MSGAVTGNSPTLSLTHSLTLSVFTAFSASQPNNKPRRRAPLPYRRQQRLTPVVQWKQVSAQGATVAQTPAAPARHLASWNRESRPLFHISLAPNKSCLTAAFNGRLMQIFFILLIGRTSREPTHEHICDVLSHFFFVLAGINQGSCYRINHFPDDNDYDTDSSEYLLRKCFTQSAS